MNVPFRPITFNGSQVSFHFNGCFYEASAVAQKSPLVTFALK